MNAYSPVVTVPSLSNHAHQMVPATMQPHSGGMMLYAAPAAVAPPQPQQQGPVVSLEDIIKCIAKRWKTATLVAGVTASMITFFLLGRVPQFTSDSTLLMQANDNKVFAFEKVINNASEVNSAPALLHNHKNQMQSRKFREFLYNRMDQQLLEAYVTPIKSRPLASQLIHTARALISTPPAPASPEEARKGRFFGLMEQVKVDYVKESYLLQVSVTHHDADIAANVANEYLRLYEHYSASEDNDVVKEAVAFQRKEAEALQTKVQQQERTLANYLQEKGLVADDSLGGAAGEKIKLLGNEIAKTEVDLTRAEEVLRLVGDARGDVQRLLAIEAISNHVAVGSLRSAWVEKQREKESIDQVYLKKHPRYLDFYQQYEAVKSELARGIDLAVADMNNRVESLRSGQRSLRERLRENESTILGLGQDAVKKNELKRQLDADRDTLAKLLSRLNEARVSSDFNRTTNLRIADIAVPSDKPHSPNKPVSLLIGGFTFGGLFVAIPIVLALLGLLRTHGLVGTLKLTQGPQTPTQQSMPVQSMPVQSQPVEHGLRIASSPVNAAGRVAMLPHWEQTHDGLVKAFREKTATAEDFLAIAKTLANSVSSAKSTLLISSVQPGEGKSQLAAGLAAAYAMNGKRTLLVDCHLGAPSVQNWLPQGPGVPGIQQLLKSGESVMDLNSLRYGRSDLFVLHTGGATPEPYFFSTSGFAEMLKIFSQQVDVVILDAPCLQETAEILGIAPHADHAVLAWNPTITGKEHLQWGADFAGSLGSKLGVSTVEWA